MDIDLVKFGLLYKYFQMGVIHSIYQLGFHKNRQYSLDAEQIHNIQLLTPLQKWLNSIKIPQHLLDFMHTADHEIWLNEVFILLKNTRHRDRYQAYLQTILLYLESNKAQKENWEQRVKIYTYFYKKMADSFFIGQEFNQKIIENYAMTSTQKLIYLYDRFYLKNNQSYVEKALLHNYPNIFEQMQIFAEQIIERYVFIDNEFSYQTFIVTLEQLQKFIHNLESKLKYFQREIRQQTLNKIKYSSTGCQIYMPMVRAFLKHNQGYSAELTIRNLISGFHILTKQQQLLYLYTKAYNYFLYNLGMINLQYHQFAQFTIQQLIHHFIIHKRPQEIGILKSIFTTTLSSQPYYFQDNLEKYIFSEKCPIMICLSLLENCELKVNESLKIQFFKKLYDCNYQVAKSKVRIINIVQKILNCSKKEIIKIQSILNLADIFVFFNISNKLSVFSKFFQENYSIAQCQQHALGIFKSLVSKYYISDPNRSIRLPQTNEILSLSDAQSILKICLYIKQNLALNGGKISSSQIHQIIFKYMLIFYRFEQIEMLLSEQIAQNYGIIYQTIEPIIIESIVSSFKRDRLSNITHQIHKLIHLLRNQSSEKDIVKAMHKFLKYFEDHDIELSSKQREEGINIKLLYWIVQNYRQRLTVFEFTMLYQQICIIRGNQINNTQYLINNQFLQFQVFLAKEAYAQGYISYGEDIIKQLLKYDPPWLCEELIKIIDRTKTSNLPEHLLNWAFDYCIKGKDMQYILQIKKGKTKSLTIGTKIITMFQNTRIFTVINDDLIADDKEYRNHVAEAQFNQNSLKDQSFDLFFRLFATDCHRSFHYALMQSLQLVKLQFFLNEGMKKNRMIRPYELVPYYFRYIFFSFHKFINGKSPNFKEYETKTIQDLMTLSEKTIIDYKQQVLNTYIGRIYQKLYRAQCVITYLGKTFIQTYLDTEDVYLFLFDDSYRKKTILLLKQEPMGTTNIIAIRKLTQVLSIDLFDLCLNHLFDNCNSSDTVSQVAEHILTKIVVWTQELNIGKFVLGKMCTKIHSTFILLKIMQFLVNQPNEIYRTLITQNHLQILRSLDSVQTDRQFFGLIPENYFFDKITYRPIWPLSEQHKKILNKVSAKNNIFVLGKVMYFFYGMNTNIERQVLANYVKENDQQDGVDHLKAKLSIP